MRRGTLVTYAGGTDYAGKPRPAVVVQSDLFATIGSVTLCLLTSREIEPGPLRVPIAPNRRNGLSGPSWVMIDKISTQPQRKVGRVIGELEPAQMRAVSDALILFLGVAERADP